MGGVNASNLMKSLSVLFYLEVLTVSLATLHAAEIKDPTGFYKPFSDPSITKAPAKDQPPFPACGPATGSFNGLHPKSKFLAIGNRD